MKLTWKIWLLIIVLFFSLLSIFGFPPMFLEKGVLITSVDSHSVAFEQGLRQGQIIKSIDGSVVNTLDDYYSILKDKYISGEDVKTTITTKDTEFILFSNSTLGIVVSDIPKTNIKTGLDLSGGARALVQAQDIQLTTSETNELAQVIENRLNVYGISDMRVVPISDLSGENYVRIEIAGATPNDLEKLISEQGKFEAKIGNETVFIGGKDNGITSVARSGQQSGVESCQESSEGGSYCNFRFAVFLSEDAAQRHADVTNTLGINPENPEYLSEKLDLYLDDVLVDSLFISKDLKGRATTQISISGSGSGETRDDAYTNAVAEMNHLQTILITGSLPYKLEIVKLDMISPFLGKEFLKNIFIAGLVAILAVAILLLIRYRKLKSSLAVLLTMLSELILILGVASFIEWNLDLPSIAGILATIGTGVDDQIVLIDESRRSMNLSISQRIKRAFSIILGAYFTVLVSLLPLLWAGAGLLKGFAITTIIGISVGVFITRPAFADVLKKIEE